MLHALTHALYSAILVEIDLWEKVTCKHLTSESVFNI